MCTPHLTDLDVRRGVEVSEVCAHSGERFVCCIIHLMLQFVSNAGNRRNISLGKWAIVMLHICDVTDELPSTTPIQL